MRDQIPVVHQDLPRDEIMALAQKTLDRLRAENVFAKVHFKFTCEQCGGRVTFSEPNKLYERGTCDQCGHDMPVPKAGFSLMVGYR
jgi:transcription initiation factor IIE alpha subunit